jgi:hypothetical protein
MEGPRAWRGQLQEPFAQYAASGALNGRQMEVAAPFDCGASQGDSAQVGKVCVVEVRTAKSNLRLTARLLGTGETWTVIATVQDGKWTITGQEPAATR